MLIRLRLRKIWVVRVTQNLSAVRLRKIWGVLVIVILTYYNNIIYNTHWRFERIKRI
jgi:hypothetical protein